MGIMLFLFGMFIGIGVVSGFEGLVKYFANKAFGRQILIFRYLSFYYQNDSGFSGIAFSPICELTMYKENDTEKSVLTSFVIQMAVCTVAYAVYNTFFVKIFLDEVIDRRLTAFFLGIGAWSVIYLISEIFFFIGAAKSSKDGLSKRAVEIIEKMKNGVSLGDIDIPEADITEYSSLTKSSYVRYNCLAFMKHIWDGDYEGAGDIIYCLEKAIPINYIDRPLEYLVAFTPAYYNLMFYYSFVNYNKMRAEYFFEIVEKQLRNDRDANGRRNLAYYMFYVRNDINAADHYISEAVEVLPNPPLTSAERIYEDKLIKQLISAIYERRKQEEAEKAENNI